jgi:hypothetical protein
MKYTMVLSSIGDVNGDGLSDFAISSSSYFSGRGVVYVIFGTHVNNNINIDLDTMGISVGITITHSGSSAGIGNAVSAAGDVNGDGVNDIVISSYTTKAFVIYGGSSITNMDLMNLDMSQGYSISSSLSQSIVDFRIAGNIDVNHDGISDIAIGCPYDSMAERVYVIYGTNHRYRSNVTLEYMPSAQGLVIVTSDLHDKSGYYISSAGDYNNDTYRDLLVSAPYAFNKVGGVYMITNALESNTRTPTSAPNNLPKPSKRPSLVPTVTPSRVPSVRPSKCPTIRPTRFPQSSLPIYSNSTYCSPSCDPTIDSGDSNSDTTQPSGDSMHDTTYKPSRRPSKHPSQRPTHSASSLPTNTLTSLVPTQSLMSVSPSMSLTTSPSPINDHNRSSILDTSAQINTAAFATFLTAFAIFALLTTYFQFIYKLFMELLGYDFRKPMNFDTCVFLRVASLEECIQHFWVYRGVIYKKGAVTDELFARSGFHVSLTSIINVLDHICMNPNIYIVSCVILQGTLSYGR